MTSSYTPGALTALTLPIHGRLRVGHVDEAGRHNPDVTIPAFEYRAGVDFYADATCQSCRGRSELSISEDGTEALSLVIHDTGCPQLAAIRALMPR